MWRVLQGHGRGSDPAHRSGLADGGLEQDAVALHELFEGVADGVACLPDPDGLHHPRVAELPNTQLPVEQLTHTHKHCLTKYVGPKSNYKVQKFLHISSQSCMVCERAD